MEQTEATVILRPKKTRDAVNEKKKQEDCF